MDHYWNGMFCSAAFYGVPSGYTLISHLAILCNSNNSQLKPDDGKYPWPRRFPVTNRFSLSDVAVADQATNANVHSVTN